ncbi:MAG: Type IV pilus assembly protein PilM [Parcubacteria group bacterium GW2011_GWA2_51_10]|nr:MAG: Type IV pilus assembly protein PilM [Parcubacteria group bacterium GW2011_GWA2_51_10]
MHLLPLAGNSSHGSNTISRTLARWFPTPKLLAPRAAGIDISDASIKWLALEPFKSGSRVVSYGREPLAEGVVVEGVVHDEAALAEVLHTAKRHLGNIEHAHASLPEESAFVFSMSVPEKTPRDQVLSMIEFELNTRVPIAPNDAIYDFSVITERDGRGSKEIGVVVVPREIAESYAAAFDMAGIGLLSLELDARSIARAINSPEGGDSISLSVDFGRSRTGFAVLKSGIPIFTSTVAVGGEKMTNTLIEKMSMSLEEAEKFKDNEGLLALTRGAKSGKGEVLAAAAGALADEVAKHYHYWDTRRNEMGERMTPVERVLLLGGSSNLKGLADYISLRVQAPCDRPNVWRNVCSFDEYIPPIDRPTSFQFATAIGLALRS